MKEDLLQTLKYTTMVIMSLDHQEDVADSARGSAPFPKKTQHGMKEFFWEVIRFALLALIIVFPIRFYVAQPYIVSGASMDPTFANGNYLIVDQITYRFEEPERGDVIVFRYPQDPSKFFIKRIVGLPYETIKMQNGTLFAAKEGNTVVTVKEPYVKQEYTDSFEITLGGNEYFVMGDNRKASLDSRVWGALDKEFIVGRALVRLFPIDTIDMWPGKAYFSPLEERLNDF